MNRWNNCLPWEGNPVSLAGRIPMIRTQEWKYMEKRGRACELYDVVNDPHELVNPWNRPTYPAAQRDLEARLESLA